MWALPSTLRTSDNYLGASAWSKGRATVSWKSVTPEDGLTPNQLLSEPP